MPDQQRVHRFRDHAVAGVNWRQTRFVDEVPSSRVCALCRMIPTRTVLLPCSHALCQSCHAASSEACGGRCPMDQEQFEEDECVSYDLPTRKAIAFKVYCWNELHGCEYEGAMNDMLRHFEKECRFHAIECVRCGEAVLHRELARHYMTGCTAGVPSACTENTSSESGTLTLQDVRNALEEVKTLLRDKNDGEALPAIQSQLNELTEQVRNQEYKMVKIPGEDRAPTGAKASRHAAMAFRTGSQEPTSTHNPLNVASASSLSRPRSKERFMNQMPEDIFNLSPRLLGQMQKTSTRDYPQHAVEYTERPNGTCHLAVDTPLFTTRSWTGVSEQVTYVLTLANCTFPSTEKPKLVCRITVLHTKDACFTVEVRQNFCHRFGRSLSVEIAFSAVGYNSRCLAPRFDISASDRSKERPLKLDSPVSPCNCQSVGDSQLHFHGMFKIPFCQLAHAIDLREGNLTLRIELSRNPETQVSVSTF
ncbi:uncharacterized protein LOC142761702 isoform X2 [Rhipicephalus microplus]|uniref:uncharacterized protein LOC142761702 isoform X2 n=1 Tax=Rhipicephalus microplus TaxID=6941 RepID=UPI003F6D6031